MSEVTFALLPEKIGTKSYFIPLSDGTPAGFFGVDLDTKYWTETWVSPEFRGDGIYTKFEEFLSANFPGQIWTIVGRYVPPSIVLRYQLKDGFTVVNPEECAENSLELEQKRSALGESTYAKVLEIWESHR